MPEHLHDNYGPEARFAVEAEAALPTIRWDEEVARGLELGLPGADSIVDKRIPTFSRGELPHFAGINTFLKAPYLEDVRRCGEYDVAVLGAPFDGGTTYRSGTRFGPQGIRKISALYGPYSFELGVDLRETITLKFIQLIADAAPLAGMEVVECSPPYDNAEITALISTRVICDTLGCLVRSGHLPEK